MYSFDARLRYSECGSDGRLTFAALLDYFQDACFFQSEDRGVGISRLYEKKRAWVLSSWQIVVKKLPKFGRMVTVTTLPYELKGFYGLRNFALCGKTREEKGMEADAYKRKETGQREKDGSYKGEGYAQYPEIDGESCFAYANSVWIYLDTETGKPARIDEEMRRAYTLDERLPMAYAPRKLPAPETCVRGEAVQIKKHHLDTNQHVNNAQYVLMALDAAQATGAFSESDVHQLRVEYKKAAHLNDVLCPKLCRDDGRIVASLEKDGGETCAVVEFLLR